MWPRPGATVYGACLCRPTEASLKLASFFTSYGPSGPDGLAMDESGRLLVANPGLGYVWVLGPRAEPEEILTGPAGASITNLAFGGAERKTLFCTDSTHGNILQTEMAVAGTSLHHIKQQN